MLHNRVEEAYLVKFNETVSAFIDSIVLAEVNVDSKIQRIPFYVAMMIGDQAQRETYARVLLAISADGTSDDISRKIPLANERYFRTEMCTRILQSVPQVAMYESQEHPSGATAKRDYLQSNWQLVRDNVEFTREVSAEDFKAMEVLRWL